MSAISIDFFACQPPTPADAGPDQTGAATCGLTQVTLAANTPSIGTGAWSIQSGTGGSFGNASSPTSTFSGVAGSTYTLRWTVSNDPCTASFDDVVVTFNQSPTTANAGPDQTGVATCDLTQVTLAANTPSVGTGAWSIQSGIGGSFGNASSPTSTFSGVAGSTYTLRWTVSNAPCTASTDDVVVTFNQTPTTANAGPDQTGVATCGLTQVTLAANTPSVGTGAWSIQSGTGGSFGNASSPTSTFSGVAGSTYTLRWTVSNAPCTASTDDVVVTFNQTPSFSACPGTTTVSTTSGCSASATYTAAAATTQPASTVTYTFLGATTGSGSGTGSGSTFNIGTTTVLLSATSSCGTSSCIFSVVVQAPAINVRGNSTNIADGDNTPSLADHTDFGQTNGAPIVRTFTVQNTGTANLPVSAISLSGGGGAFAVGPLTPASPIPPNGSATFTVTYTGTSVGTQTATVNIANGDCTKSTYDFAIRGELTCSAPSFTTCPSAPLTFNTTPGTCSVSGTYNVVANGLPVPVLTFATSGATTAAGIGTGSGVFFNKGATTVTITATNPCGAPSCVFTVNVTDNVPPTVVCKPATVNLSAAGTGSITTASVFNGGSDNCGTVNQQSVTPNSFTCSNVGSNTVTLTVNDGNGNTATCNAVVTVADVTAPSVTCKPATVNLNAAGTGSITTASVFQSGSDNCGTVNQQSVTPNYFTCNDLGSNTVTLTVNDGNGNTATCNAVVTVNDVTPPTITCPDNLTVTSTTFDCSAVVDYSVNAQDNCAVTTLNYSNGNDPGSEFSGGSTLVKVTAFDAAGNSANCQFWVFVQAAEETCDGVDNDCDGLIDEAEDFEQNTKFADPSSGLFDQFGNAVAIHGDRALVGVERDDQNGFNAGAAQLFERNDQGQWLPTKRLTAANGAADDQYGHAVALHGDYALVAANLRDDNGINVGLVYVYERNQGGANQWGAVGTLAPGDPTSNLNFGGAIAFDGRFALVGANLDDEQASNAGAAYLFDAQNGWAQVAKLKAADGQTDDDFGRSVAVDGAEFALVGAPAHDAAGTQAGAAYLFGRQPDGTWLQVKKLVTTSTVADDRLGFSVALHNGRAVVGAPRSDFRASNGGIAYVFERNSGGLNNWGEASKLFAYDAEPGDQLGRSVAIEGDLAVVATPFENAKGSGAGAAYVFHRPNGGVWIFAEKIVDPTGNLDDNLFSALALSQSTILAGAPRDDANNQPDNGTAQWFEPLCRPASDDANFTPFNPQLALKTAPNAGVTLYPVPFSEQLRITFDLPVAAEQASVLISNPLGQVVTQLHLGVLSAGAQQFDWRPEPGLPAGTYFVRIEAGAFREVRSVVRSAE